MQNNRAHTFLHFYRHYLMKPLTFVLFIGLLALFGYTLTGEVLKSNLSSLQDIVQDAAGNYELYEQTLANNEAFEEHVLDSWFDTMTYMLDNGQESTRVMQAINSTDGSFKCYCLQADGTLLSPEGLEFPDLSEEEQDTLRTTGMVSKDDSYLCLHTASDGNTLILIFWPFAESVDSASLNARLSRYKEGVMICAGEDGRVLYASDDCTYSGLSELELSPIYVDDDQVSRRADTFFYRTKGGSLFDSGFLASYDIGDGVVCCSYIDIGYLILTILKLFLPSSVLCIIFYFVALRFCRRYRNMWKQGILRGTRVLHVGKLRADMKLLRSLLSLAFLCSTIILIVSVGMHLLNTQTTEQYELKAKLTRVVGFLDSDAEISENIDDRLQSNAVGMTKFLTDMFAADSTLMSHDRLVELADIAGVDAIDIYDKTGTVVASSTDYTGYALSTVETDPEYLLRSILCGESDSITVSKSVTEGSFYTAERRKDCVGIVRLTTSSTDSQIMYNAFSVDIALSHSGIGSSDIIMLYKSNLAHYYRYDGETDLINYHVNDLPDEVINSDTCRTITIDGEKCTVCTDSTDDMILLCVDSHATKDYTAQFICIATGCACLLFIFFMLVGTVVYTDGTFENQPAEVGGAAVADILKTRHDALRGFIIASLIFIAVYYILDLLLCPTPVVSYLLSDSWPHGFNFLSIICAIAGIALTILVRVMLQLFYKQLVKWIPRRTTTGAQLMYSCLRVVILVAGIIFALKQIGINTTTIIGGLGLGGVALSLGAKDTINDLISGIFMILDRHVHIGDYINVAGFEGVVVAMNIRTTKVENNSGIKSINNSTMVNIMRYNTPNNNAFFIVSFTVDYSVNPEIIRKLIDDNQERFLAAGPGVIKSKVEFTGVTSMGKFGYECGVNSYVSPLKIGKASRIINEVIRDLFEENGIKFSTLKPY